ncbi:MAG: hypothetical protein WB471_01430 [Nocardioides sp.]
MLRTKIARVASAALVTSLLVVASPPASQAAPDYKPWGTVKSKNHVLKNGCHRYTYRYRVNAPSDDWSAEIRFISPNGTGLAASKIDSEPQGPRGKRRVTVCQPSTSLGRHKIKMEIIYTEGGTLVSGRVKPTFFRFVSR